MEYKLKTTKDDLYRKGFSYNKITTIECELTVELQTGNVTIRVFNYGTSDLYTPYYHHEYGRYKTVDDIEKAIDSYAKKIGMKKVKDKKK